MTLIASYQNKNGSERRAELSRNTVNLLVSLENGSYTQMLDTMGNLWKKHFISDISEIETVLQQYEKYDILNFALVHHGKRYSSADSASSNIRWTQRVIDKIMDLETILSKEIDLASKEMTLSTYIDTLLGEVSSQIDFIENPTWELPCKDGCKIIASLKLVFDSIADTGNYISVACNEADDENFLDVLSKLTTKNIKLYASTNQATIGIDERENKTYYKYAGKEINNYGSLLNIPLTSRIVDHRGWFLFDCARKEKQATRKDIMLNSSGRIPFQLIPLNSKSPSQIKNRHLYYSKKIKDWYVQNWGEAAYEQWRNLKKAEL